MSKQYTKSTFSLPFTPEEAADTCWRALTESANHLFQDGRFEDAGRLYEIALGEAEDIFLSAQVGAVYDNIDPAPLLVTSATNLAENHCRKGESSRAYKTLSTAIDHLTTALNDPGAPRRFAEECAYHLGYIVTRLASLMRHLGASNDTISAEIEPTKQAFFAFSTRNQVKH